MAYRLQPDEGVRAGLRRCAAEQLNRALTELRERVDTDPEEVIHSARKRIKKERSLLRLARGSMDPGRRRAENRTLRDAARNLSRARDAEAMIETLDDLAERYVGQLPEREFEAVRQQLQRRRDAEHADGAASQRAVDELAGVRARVAEWALS